MAQPSRPRGPINANDLKWNRFKNLSEQSKHALSPTEYSKDRSLRMIEQVQQKHEHEMRTTNDSSKRREEDRYLQALEKEIRHIKHTK